MLRLEGRKREQLTDEEWLYLYSQVEQDLVGAQADIFAKIAAEARSRILEKAMEAVAV